MTTATIDNRTMEEFASDIQTLREKVAAKVAQHEQEVQDQAVREPFQDGDKKLDLRHFKKWLRENKDRIVGYVGYYGRVTPLLRYCTENNVSLTSKSKSKWGSKYDEYCQNYNGVPGRYTGGDALGLLCDVIGYHHYCN